MSAKLSIQTKFPRKSSINMFIIVGKNVNRMSNYKFQRATKYKNYKYTSTNLHKNNK